MSMPQPLTIAVIASTEAGLATVKGAALSKEGIAPRYRLVTLAQFDQLQANEIGLWIALDAQALDACQSVEQCGRGFYDLWFPESVVSVNTREQFNAVTDQVWEAFCASS